MASFEGIILFCKYGAVAAMVFMCDPVACVNPAAH